MNSNQSWNHTNDKFIEYSAIKKQKNNDELKLTFKLKYNYDIIDALKKHEISCYISSNEIYLKLKSIMKVISFCNFIPESTNINILPFAFVINKPIINTLHNKIVSRT